MLCFLADRAVWISAAALILVIFVEPLYHDTLFNYSLTLIEQLQKTTSDGSIKFWTYYTDIVDEAMQMMPFIVCLAFTCKMRDRAFYYICTLSCCYCLVNAAKMVK